MKGPFLMMKEQKDLSELEKAFDHELPAIDHGDLGRAKS
jgi:hypothetical protein